MSAAHFRASRRCAPHILSAPTTGRAADQARLAALLFRGVHFASPITHWPPADEVEVVVAQFVRQRAPRRCAHSAAMGAARASGADRCRPGGRGLGAMYHYARNLSTPDRSEILGELETARRAVSAGSGGTRALRRAGSAGRESAQGGTCDAGADCPADEDARRGQRTTQGRSGVLRKPAADGVCRAWRGDSKFQAAARCR